MTSKTDEAERLREEVARMYPDGVMAGEYKQSYKLKKSDESINKILDAVEIALLNCGEDADPLDILDAINKLRPKP